MKKIFVSVLVFVLSLLGAAPVGASGSPMIGLSVSVPKVFEATQTSFSPTLFNSAGVSSELFKYEIVRLSPASASLRVVTRQISGSSCNGTIGSSIAGYQTCSVTTDARRVVMGASSASFDSSVFSGSFLSLSALVATPAVFGVRAWLDANDDSTRNAFEPYSAETRIEVLPVSMARGALEFEFEPPLLGGTELKARVYQNSIVGSMLEHTRLGYRAYEVTPLGNRQVSGSLTNNYHPQINAWEFSALATELRYPAVYLTELVYERTPGQFVVLASERFDYRAHLGLLVDTLVSGASSSVLSQVDEPFNKKLTLNADSGSFSYKMTLTMPDGKPVVGQAVYFYVDLFDLLRPQDVRLNNSFLIGKNNLFDRVLMKRVSNAAGEISLNFSSSTRANLGLITIDYRLNGLQSTAYAGGSKHDVVWAHPAPKIVTASNSNSDGRTLDLSFALQLSDGTFPGESFDVFVSAEHPIDVLTPLVTATTGGSHTVALSRFATGSGSSLVTAMLVARDGQVSEGYWRVDWGVDGDYSLSAVGLAVRPPEGIRINRSEFWPGTQILAVEGEALNGFGSPIMNSLNEKTVDVSASVAGFSASRAVVPVAADGSFKTFLPLYSVALEGQSVVVSAALFRQQSALATISCVSPVSSCETRSYSDVLSEGPTVDEGVTSDVQAWTRYFPGDLKIYARNVVGAGKVRFVVNDREIAWVRASNSNDPKLNVSRDGMVRSLLVRDMLPGRNVIEIYVGGDRVVRRIFTNF